jgi:hypothetical protein
MVLQVSILVTGVVQVELILIFPVLVMQALPLVMQMTYLKISSKILVLMMMMILWVIFSVEEKKQKRPKTKRKVPSEAFSMMEMISSEMALVDLEEDLADLMVLTWEWEENLIIKMGLYLA